MRRPATWRQLSLALSSRLNHVVVFVSATLLNAVTPHAFAQTGTSAPASISLYGTTANPESAVTDKGSGLGLPTAPSATDGAAVKNSATSKRGEWAFAPIPMINPTIGDGGGGAVLYTTRFKGDDVSPPSTFGGVAAADRVMENHLAGHVEWWTARLCPGGARVGPCPRRRKLPNYSMRSANRGIRGQATLCSPSMWRRWSRPPGSVPRDLAISFLALDLILAWPWLCASTGLEASPRLSRCAGV